MLNVLMCSKLRPYTNKSSGLYASTTNDQWLRRESTLFLSNSFPLADTYTFPTRKPIHPVSTYRPVTINLPSSSNYPDIINWRPSFIRLDVEILPRRSHFHHK